MLQAPKLLVKSYILLTQASAGRLAVGGKIVLGANTHRACLPARTAHIMTNSRQQRRG
jgi:hypothetical protein